MTIWSIRSADIQSFHYCAKFSWTEPSSREYRFSVMKAEFQISLSIPCALLGQFSRTTTLGWTPCVTSHHWLGEWTELPSMRNSCGWPRMVLSYRTSPWTGAVSLWMVSLPDHWNWVRGSNFHAWGFPGQPEASLGILRPGVGAALNFLRCQVGRIVLASFTHPWGRRNPMG
jgi:hypothetical protein